jgi:hypothetical protein
LTKMLLLLWLMNLIRSVVLSWRHDGQLLVS